MPYHEYWLFWSWGRWLKNYFHERHTWWVKTIGELLHKCPNIIILNEPYIFFSHCFMVWRHTHKIKQTLITDFTIVSKNHLFQSSIVKWCGSLALALYLLIVFLCANLFKGNAVWWISMMNIDSPTLVFQSWTYPIDHMGWRKYYPIFGYDIQVFRPWGSLSNTDHGGSRIFWQSDWLYHMKQLWPICGSATGH